MTTVSILNIMECMFDVYSLDLPTTLACTYTFFDVTDLKLTDIGKSKKL
jgi:hypothetical protein